MTSNPYGDPLAIALNPAAFTAGGLQSASFARPGKLFTANAGLMLRSVGRLDSADLHSVIDAVVALLRPAKP
jgi:mRNA interferase MazF